MLKTMTDSLSWTTALQWGFWGVVMALVMGWLGRSRFRARPTSDARKLAHPPSTLIVGLICFGFFAGIAIVSNVFPNKTTTWWTTAVFFGFALLSAPMVIDYFMAKHEVSDEGLSYRQLLVGARKYLRWSDLRVVRYAPVMKWFRLETRSGEVARISVMLMGLPEFARVLLEHAPGGAVESGTLPILQATAQGNPPSVWT
jgi:hypothetical protein